MNYIPSVNIENGLPEDFHYIVTPNTEAVWGNIIDSFNSGFHSFSIIGTYGTGKSSFLAAIERELISNSNRLIKNKDVFPCKKYEFLKIVGDYNSLSSLLAQKLGLKAYASSEDVLKSFNDYYNKLKREDKILFLVVDEFGKILEHAAANNPEQELYFLQKIAEYVNFGTHNIIFITTLHQNFSTYSYKLSETQRNEWNKVKGRFKEVVFVEPVEQLLSLTALPTQLNKTFTAATKTAKENIKELYLLAKQYKITTPEFEFETASKFYPLDPISSVCLTYSMQRYGQNERTLFSFLASKDRFSLSTFRPEENRTYNLADVHDYIIFNFFTFLSEANADSMDWRAIRIAIERIESGIVPSEMVDGCLAIVKSIGLLSLFCRNITIDNNLLSEYAIRALGIVNPASYIEKLTVLKIIRYASYKAQYILFEGTDIDIESELYKAASIVPTLSLTVENIGPYVHQKAILAQSAYYKKGTPRYFQYVITNVPYTTGPQGDVDGYINLIFPQADIMTDVLQASNTAERAILYAYFKNTDTIIRHLHEIKKLQYILTNVVLEDRVAQKEINNLLIYEEQRLNHAINDSLFDEQNVEWVYRTHIVKLATPKMLNQYLSYICDDVYSKTPILRNELFNRHKVNSVISSARVNLLQAILDIVDKEDLGFDKKAFPPGKAIYSTLLQATGIIVLQKMAHIF